MPNSVQQSFDYTALDQEQWLHMYQQMCKIRTFEENANELYTSAKMPGLTHLYIGEEAVAKISSNLSRGAVGE